MNPASDLIQGSAEGRAVLRALLCSLAAPEPTAPLPKDVLLIDSVFAGWPLDDPAVLQALQVWMKPAGRRLRIVGLDFDALARTHPRFSRWRRDWAHCIESWRPSDGLWAPDLHLLLAGSVAVQWQDAPDGCLRRVTEKAQVQVLRDRSAAFLQRCEPAWPVTTLGL